MKHLTKYDCYNAILQTAGTLYGVDIAPKYIGNFGFEYAKYDTPLSIHYDGLRTGPFINKDLLGGFCGIETRLVAKKEAQWMENDIISSLIVGDPVGVFADSYCLPWNTSYLKNHNDHYILIIGYDESKFYIADEFNSNKLEVISRNFLMQEIKKLIFFTKKDIQEQYQLSDIIILLQENAKANSVHISELIKFREDMQSFQYSNTDILLMMEGRAELVRGLGNIGYSRENFGQALSFMKAKFLTVIFDTMLERIKQNYQEWHTLKQLLIRYIIRNKLNGCKERILHCMERIISSESEILDQIAKLKV